MTTTMRRLSAAALLMTGAVFLSRIMGYLRDAFVAAKFGATPLTDAYNAAFTIPDVLNYFLAGGTLSITFLPIYSRYLVSGDEREGNRVLSIVLTAILVVAGAGVLGLEWLAPALSHRYLAGLSDEAMAVAIRCTRVLLPAQLFFLAGAIFSATLFARGRFVAAALAPLLYNGGIIAGGAILGSRLGITSLAWGALVGAAAGPFLIPAIDATRQGARFRPSFDVAHPSFVAWLRQTLPLMAGVTVVLADDWITRPLAASDQGAITRLTVAKRLVSVSVAVAGQAIGQASAPFFARLYAEGKRDELVATFLRTVRGAGVIAILAGAWMMALAEPLVDLLFRRGRFEPADVAPTAIYAMLFAAASPFWVLQGLTARLFYAAGNTLTPMVAGTVVTVLSIPVYFLLFSVAGPTGLAIASGLAMTAHTLSIAFLSPRLFPELRQQAAPALLGLGKSVALAAISGSSTYAVARLLAPRLTLHGVMHDVVVCGVGSIVFAAVVLLAAKTFGVKEPAMLLAKLRRRASSKER